jgi:uncharacterized protein (TIGR02271 family)
MNPSQPTPAHTGIGTSAPQPGQAVALPGHVFARIEDTLPLREGNQEVILRFEDGQEMVIPQDLLERRQDGTWYLPYHLNELKAAQQGGERGNDLVIPVAQEELIVGKRQVETGRVRITKRIHTHEERVDEPLYKQEVEVTRVPVNQIVASPPQPRQDGDTMIVPVFEEVLVVEKRLRLKEELHIRQRRVTTHQPQRVVLRSEEVQVERVAAPAATKQDEGKQS